MSERFAIDQGELELSGERWPGQSPPAVLLHAGIADRRSWHAALRPLEGRLDAIAYDRRGFGRTPPGREAFTHVGDLLALMDGLGLGQAWLIGSSAGGGVALDATLTAPERVAGLVLISPGVTGAPERELDEHTIRLGERQDEAIEDDDLELVNSLDMHIWLDGPACEEGRVSGPERALALEMNGIALQSGTEDARGSGIDTWSRLREVELDVLVACGELDVPMFVEQSRELAQLLPAGEYVELAGTAHLPYLEQPQVLGELLARAGLLSA